MVENLCSLSTGEVIKCIGIKIKKIIAEICGCESSHLLELPMNFPGTTYYKYFSFVKNYCFEFMHVYKRK